MFNREIPQILQSREGETPFSSNDNEQFYEGEQELLVRTLEELKKIDLTLKDEMLRTAFQFRMQQLANENVQANRGVIEELARAHVIIEADRLLAKKRALYPLAAESVDTATH